MSTFENGWICRECWSANRDVDDRCYRCHVDRPLGAPVTTQQTASKAPAAAQIDALPAATLQAAEAVETADVAAKPRVGRYCLRCGATWLPGAGFCTQCGTAAHAAASEHDSSTAASAEPVPHARSTTRLSLPRFALGPALRQLGAEINEYYDSHERNWEAVMGALAVVSVLAGFGADRVGGLLRSGMQWIAILITVVFLVEYVARLFAARDRRAFALTHLLELAAVTPWLRLLRLGRLAWVMGLRAAYARVRGWRIRQPLAPPNGRRARLAILWLILLGVTAAATLGYSTGGGPGSEARFALVVMLLCVFSGLTAALATAFTGTPIGASDVPERLRILDELRAGNLISASEFDLHRASLMQLVSPARTADTPANSQAGFVPSPADRATRATGAS